MYLLAEKLKLLESRVGARRQRRLRRLPARNDQHGREHPVSSTSRPRCRASRSSTRTRTATTSRAGGRTWIRDYVSRFERRLYGDSFTTAAAATAATWTRRGRRLHAVERALPERGHVQDSTYMHKGAGEKLVLGPLWDFDHAIGNTIPGGQRHRRLAVQRSPGPTALRRPRIPSEDGRRAGGTFGAG